MSSKQQQRPKKSSNNNNKNNNGCGGSKKQTVDSSWKRTFLTAQSVGDVHEDKEEEEGEMCVICAETTRIQAVSQCNHPTCHKCTLRQRALYEKKACVVCRSENETVIFTEDTNKSYNQLNVIELRDERYGLLFTSELAYQEVIFLLSYSCQHCDFVGSNFRSLNDHVKQVHELQLCTICAPQKNQFPALIKAYTTREIQTHSLNGDKDGFTGHPACKYCRGKRFYSNDELNAHLKKDHEKCHVCEKIDPSTPQYFKDYESLNSHFTSGHFKCPVPSCLDQKFVVFEDQFELSTHMASEHSTIFGSNNLFSTGGQRYRSQLSTFPGAVDSSSGNRIVNRNNGEEPQDSLETKRKRLEERARHYLNYSAEDFKVFLNLNKEFKFGRISAHELKQSYESLFSQKNKQHTGGANDIYLLIYELAHLFNKSSAEYTELLAMYNQNERIVNKDEEFPVLPGSSTNLSGSWNNNNNNNKNKKQTKPKEDFPALPGAQSASKYTPVNTTVRYKNFSKPTPPPVKINKTSALSPAPVKLTYLDKGGSNSGTIKQSSTPAKNINEQLFPSLPTAPKKKVIIPRVNPIPSGSGVWGAATVGSTETINSDWPGLSSGGSSGFNNMSDLNDGLPLIAGNGKKGKKRGKQILFQMGGR